MKIGYARVSTEEQNPDLQLRALQKAGCKTVYTGGGKDLCNFSDGRTTRPVAA